MTATLDFYFDVVCPYAYLASVRVQQVAARTKARVRWRPILLGGLLRAVGAPDDPNVGVAAAKARVQRDDRLRWASLLGVPLRHPDAHPRRTVEAMRLCLAAPDGPQRVALAEDLFAAYWVRGQDVADPEVLSAIAVRHGLGAQAYRDPALRDALRDATDAAAASGAFGVPSFAVGSRLWWGQDRLPLVERALGGDPPPLHDGRGAGPRPSSLRFVHDFSSPYSYLASTQIERLARARGVAVRYEPILLGGLFREIGTPDVPMLAMNPTKQAYVRRDLHDFAEHWGVPLRFPSHFPLRSVLPLRVALVEPAATAPIYRAAWADDRRIDTPESLGAVLHEAGLPAAELLAAAERPEIKAALRDNTDRARDRGVCGVPTVVLPRDGDAVLVWGQDRLDMISAMLDGHWPAATEPA